jgi:hypothetical protein
LGSSGADRDYSWRLGVVRPFVWGLKQVTRVACLKTGELL